jgi:hypothetical protein
VEQKNPGGQALLASTIAPHPNQAHATFGATTDMPFGRLVYKFVFLLHLITTGVSIQVPFLSCMEFYL